MNKVTKKELIEAIQRLHTIYYEGRPFQNPHDALEMHKELAWLFNYAGIESTLVRNNPQEVTPDEFERAISLKEISDVWNGLGWPLK